MNTTSRRYARWTLLDDVLQGATILIALYGFGLAAIHTAAWAGTHPAQAPKAAAIFALWTLALGVLWRSIRVSRKGSGKHKRLK